MTSRSSTHSTGMTIFATAITCAGLVSTVALARGMFARPQHNDTRTVTPTECYVIGTTIICTPTTRPDTVALTR